MAWFWEQPEQTMRRELLEETGMKVETCRLLFSYSCRKPIWHRIYVFAAEAHGEPRPSWEGASSWQNLNHLPAPFFVPHLPILSRLRDPRSPLPTE
jgi:8-oxo-dGTP pyrophosphatase MutT (NUDIX family)